VTFREAEKIIKKEGWYLVRTQGSHYQYKHPTIKGMVSIPYHKGDLPKYVVASILKQAQLK
jgi:predicted RNA binding protein YcfA (HicA-like mRNA interferase family)